MLIHDLEDMIEAVIGGCGSAFIQAESMARLYDPHFFTKDAKLFLECMEGFDKDLCKDIAIFSVAGAVELNSMNIFDFDVSINPHFNPKMKMLVLPQAGNLRDNSGNIFSPEDDLNARKFVIRHELRHIRQYKDGHLTIEQDGDVMWSVWQGERIMSFDTAGQLVANKHEGNNAIIYNSLPWEKDANNYAFSLMSEDVSPFLKEMLLEGKPRDDMKVLF